MHGWHQAAIVGAAKGLEGKLRLEDASAFLRFAEAGSKVAFTPPREDAVRFTRVSEVEPISEDACIAAFADISERAQAEALTGARVLMRGEAAETRPESDGALRWIGFQVIDAHAGPIGEAVAFDLERPQALMSVRAPSVDGRTGRVALIPFVEEIISSVDEEARQIRIQAPAGLLDLPGE